MGKAHDTGPAGDECGAALPLALFGLIAVSLLVTSALLTSSAELSLSRAHRTAAQRLFAADAALEQFVAERAAMTANEHERFVTGSFLVDPGAVATYRVEVAELFRHAPVDLADGSIRRRETFSLVAEPEETYGRSVAAMIDVLRVADPISLNMDAGLTLGADATISGNATISDGSTPGAACDSAIAGAAIRHTLDRSVARQGSSVVDGEIVAYGWAGAEVLDHVLHGRTIDEIAELAHIKFGPVFGQPAFADHPSQSNEDPRYRWGCPRQLVVGCTQEQAEHFPTVAIDANGSHIEIAGSHAQGIILVMNGSLEIEGDFTFSGIVISEGSLRVTGDSRLEGAVVVGGEAIIGSADESNASGGPLIRFNRCGIADSLRSLAMQTLDRAPQVVDTPTYGWFEVIR